MAKSKNIRHNDYDDDEGYNPRNGVSTHEHRKLKRLNNMIRSGRIDPEELEELGDEL